MPRSKSNCRDLLLGLAALLACPPGTPGREPAESSEHEVKAEFIERFTYYIEWPPGAFTSDTAAFTACFAGNGPLRAHLESLLSASRLKGRRVRIDSLGAGDSAAGCHLLYIAPSESARVEQIVRRNVSSPVLTIGDSRGFTRLGVHINLFLEGTHVRFAIREAEMKARGFAISAKLLALSRREDKP